MIDFLQYIHDTNEAQNEEEIFKLFQEQLNRIGFDRVLYTLSTDHDSIGQKAGHGIMRNYPDDWMEHYTKCNYEEIDPVIKRAALSNSPFVWDRMHESMPFTQEQKKLINESREARLHCGVGLGIHCQNNELVAFGFASSEPGVDLQLDTISLVKALANQFHFAYCEFKRKKINIDQPKVNLNLTRKELEVLSWSAEGKSKSVIASIMSISDSTVDYHMRSIYKKLGVNDRILATVKAIKYGIIKI